MILVLPVIWIIFNGKITLEILIFAAVFTALIYLFMRKFLGYTVKADLKLVKIFPSILAYFGMLLVEIFKANTCVIKIIFSGRRYVTHPVIVKFKTVLKHDVFRVMLANSITLTPGTITVSLKGDELVVHCLDEKLSRGIDASVFEQQLEKLEKRWEANA